jgi:hypothetical protein
MPIVNTSQARIELSADQVVAFMDIMGEPDEGGQGLPPMVYIEETNLPGVVVVGGKGMPVTLIHHNGSISNLGLGKSGNK